MEFLESPIQSVERSLNLLFQCILFLMFPQFQKYLNPHVRNNKLVSSVFTTLVLQDQPQGYILSYFFKLVRVLALSRMLVEFSLTCIFQHVQENFSIYSIHIPRKCIESMHFHSCHSPPLKTLGRIFGKSVSPKNEGVHIGSYDLLYQNSIGKYEDDLEHQFIYILHDL